PWPGSVRRRQIQGGSMDPGFVRVFLRRLGAGGISAIAIGSIGLSTPTVASTVAIHPLVSDWAYLGNSGTPPSQAACNAVGRRCFNPTSIRNAYDIPAGLGNGGAGKTIAVVDSFGSTTIRQDLAVFNTAFGLPHLWGETGPSDPSANCASSVSPRFDIVCVQGCPAPKPPPLNNGTGLEYHNLWDLEVALDVEWAHATAPLANI